MSFLVHQLLEASARARPHAPAVVDGERTASYAELEARANRVANLLLELGLQRGERVAVFLDKSLEAVSALYGVMKAGGAYVPLDPQAPPARLGYIAANAGARVLLSAGTRARAWEPLAAAAPRLQWIVALDGPAPPGPAGLRALGGAELDAAADTAPGLSVIDDDLAYILYTSGSTGTPKGVMLSHRNCLAFVEWAVREFAVGPEDRLSSHAPLHFDLSTFDLYAAARAGASVTLVPGGVSVFPSQVREFIEAARITVWYSVPSVLAMLVLRGGLRPGGLPELRTVLFAGEVFPTVHLRRLREALPHARLANLYGPTETNVCTWWEVPPAPAELDDSIPIGRAIDNVEVFAVTDEGRRARVGEVGELYVRGATVMQGYLGDSERTAQRLVPDPFGGVLAQPVYRTGDLVEPLPGGDHRFLGRRDDQIKSRGYRIELGDVESALYGHPAVQECAVVAIPDELITNRLQAHVIVREPTDAAELSRFCSERVPAYMIPDRFVFEQELPRTSTGKVDRRTLVARAHGAPGAAAR